MRLDKRANWRSTGTSPFGISLRGKILEKEIDQFWTYQPPYWPNGVIFIHKLNEKDPTQPLIFVIPSSTRPIDNFSIKAPHLTHKNYPKRFEL